METPIETTCKLQADQAARAAQCLQETAQLVLHPPNAEGLAEGVELANATRTRALALQQQWVQDWTDWSSFARSIEGADTIPKYADRTGNIFLQASALMVTQMGQWSELMDNVGVNYAFWVHRQIDRSE